MSFKKITVMLSVLALIFIAAGCGGGGGGAGDDPGDPKLVTIAGKVDDGTANSPIGGAKCEFVDLDGEWQAATTAKSNGNFKIGLEPDQEGYIRCSHPDIAKLNLSNFISTEGFEPGNEISGQDVTPATTVVADIIHSENPAVPQARKLKLMDDIDNGDAQLNLLVDASTILCKAMLVRKIDVSFGGGPDSGIGDAGGGVGGDTGDGADFSPIPNAICEFVAMEVDGDDLFAPDLKEGEVLYDAAVSDFCKDGMVNRPDLEAIAEQVNKEFEGRQTELIAAFKNYFSDCVGRPYRTIAAGDDSATPGRYFLPIPPGVQGFVRCTPPDQSELKLATYVSTEGLNEGERILGQDVTPATTFFSHSVATKLSEDLSTVKENYLDDIAGLGEVQIKQDGEEISGFELKGSAEPNDEDVGIVAFSAASLFNILYKNGEDVDFLTALDNLIGKKEVKSADLVSLGISKPDADKWAPLVNASNEGAGDTLDTSLSEAFSTARIKVRVTDKPGGKVIEGAEVTIKDPPNGVVCEDCPGESDDDGEVVLTLTGVPETDPTQIKVETSSVTGYEDTTRMIEVVAFATVDLEFPFSYKLTVQGSGDGNGTVTSLSDGISCDVDEGVISGDNSENYDYDTEVTLTADPSSDSTFDGWSGGGCSGTADCTVTVNRTRTVTAEFTLKPVTQSGSLQVTISPTAAVSAGAKWRVDGGSWRNSGYTQSGLAVGNYTVEFSTVSGWNRPANQTVTITHNQTTSAGDTYSQQTGSLRVTISPTAAVSAGAQWRVDGGSWRNSGYTQSSLSVGSHTVEFSTISNWAKPGNQAITITHNQTASATGTYSQQTGSLRVTISPTAAVSAGAQWRVDGGSWRSSGYTQSGLSVGSHLVEFSTISGWNKPANQTVSISAYQTTSAGGTYTTQTGSLRVTILPSGAVSAGAQWRVDGGSWRSSGYTQSGLTIGNHTVEFSTVSGWTKPSNQTVSINATQTTTASGTYVYVPPTGSLRVTILPSGAVSAGAQWRVDSGSWRSTGYTLSGLTTGNHTVEFSTVSGWTKPANQTVSISTNQTTTTSGTYVFIPQTGSLRVTILPSGAVSAGAQWRVDSGSWRSTGYTLSGLSIGNHTVEFSTISGWNRPSNQTVSINANQTTNASGTYTEIFACSTQQVAGSDTPDTRQIELGQAAGTFQFEYETYSQQDRIIVRYQNVALFDTGCVGASGTRSITYSGNSTQVSVQVIPNCAGGSGTQWNYTVHCPSTTPSGTYTNSLGMTFRRLNTGTFAMGSPTSEPGRSTDEIQHQVTLTRAFYMQTTEVTQSQWSTVMGSNPSSDPSCGGNCPVENISWNNIQSFISELNARGEGTYRLPTEAEWEYAARAGSTTAFANGGITELSCGLDPNLNAMGWYCYNSGERLHTVAQKSANNWGLYDMHGNIWEWCQDWYGPYPSGSVTNPTGPSSGTNRVARGGGFRNPAYLLRSAQRGPNAPLGGDPYTGFRLVRN
jgi:formylglycine-generating enzyme required for sulfatase activity